MALFRTRSPGRTLVSLAGVAAAVLALAPGVAHGQAADTTAPAPVAVVDHAKKISLPGELPGITSAPWDLTVTPNAVWVLEPRAGMVYRVNPKTNRVAARVKLPAPGCVPRTCPGTDRIVGDANNVWVVNNQAASLVHIDARTNKVRESTAITAPTNAPPLPDTGGAWYTPDPTSGDIVYIDAATGDVEKTAHVGVAPVWPVAIVDDTLWASSSVNHGPGAPPDEVLHRINRRTGEVEASVPGPSGAGAALGREFWLNRFCCPSVTQVDGSAGTPGLDVHVDGFSDFFAAGEGSVWVRLYTPDLQHHTLTHVNPDDGSTETFELPTTELTGGIGVGHHSVWIANWNENAIYRMPVTVR